MTRENKLLDVAQTYNMISAHRLPDGGICLFLNHRSTMDDAVAVRVCGDENIAFMYGSGEEQILNDRINEGGPWDEQKNGVL